MLEFLNSIDRSLFLFVNARLANDVTDFVMPVVTDGDILAVVYGLAMVIILIKGGPRLRWLVLFSGVTLLLTDQLTAGFMKQIFERARPCHLVSGIDLVEINLLVSCGAGYAMPSTHATNAFGQAILFGLVVRPIRVYLYGLASLVALSRVFVGVHYPGDILAGAIIVVLFSHKQLRIKQINISTIQLHRKFNFHYVFA